MERDSADPSQPQDAEAFSPLDLRVVDGNVEDAAVRPVPSEGPGIVEGLEGDVNNAREPRTRDELRAHITGLRGRAPSEEELDHIVAAGEEGNWIN